MSIPEPPGASPPRLTGYNIGPLQVRAVVFPLKVSQIRGLIAGNPASTVDVRRFETSYFTPELILYYSCAPRKEVRYIAKVGQSTTTPLSSAGPPKSHSRRSCETEYKLVELWELKRPLSQLDLEARDFHAPAKYSWAAEWMVASSELEDVADRLW